MEQTASLMVDNGEVITGSAPGNLRQLNAKAGLYIGNGARWKKKNVGLCALTSDTLS